MKPAQVIVIHTCGARSIQIDLSWGPTRSRQQTPQPNDDHTCPQPVPHITHHRACRIVAARDCAPASALSVMRNAGMLLVRGVLATQVWIHRRTKGRRAGSVRGTPVLLPTTTGRKSGERRTRRWATCPTWGVPGVWLQWRPGSSPRLVAEPARIPIRQRRRPGSPGADLASQALGTRRLIRRRPAAYPRGVFIGLRNILCSLAKSTRGRTTWSPGPLRQGPRSLPRAARPPRADPLEHPPDPAAAGTGRASYPAFRAVAADLHTRIGFLTQAIWPPATAVKGDMP
jgi:hypothetical protein